MVKRTFAEQRNSEHLALVAALLQACEYCEAPANRPHLIEVLSRPEYVGASAQALRCGITGEFDFGNGSSRTIADFTMFHRHGANEPSSDKAAWVLQRMRSAGLCTEPDQLNFTLGRQIFRADLFEKAKSLRDANTTTHETEPKRENQLVQL